jgi:TetR/AcrR family transcriptional regulator
MVKNENEKQTEEIIFDAAMAIFEEKGFAAARMQEIADRAGMNKSLLHYYFRTKEQLFEAVFNKLLEKMFSKIIGVFMSDKPFEEKIRLYYEEHINFFQKNPGLPIFIMSEIAHNPERLKKQFGGINYLQIRDTIMKVHAKEMKESGINKEDWPQFMITVISLTVFPYAAKEIIKMFLSQSQEKMSFNEFMNDRKTFAADFVISAINNMKRNKTII